MRANDKKLAEELAWVSASATHDLQRISKKYDVPLYILLTIVGKSMIELRHEFDEDERESEDHDFGKTFC